MASSNRFSNKEYIGEGGMGEVYKVFDNNLGKTCALKLYKQSLSESETKAAVRESAIWFKFRQFGHVVEVYEILRFESGKIGVLMEYIENGSLRNQLNAGNLSMKDKVLALYDVSCALMNCLEILPGFCHLDIKPDNCLRTRYGLTKLTDFGLASCNRVDLSREVKTISDQGFVNSIYFRSKFGAICAGTPLYMSPEQILGANTVGEKSDVYALGVLALELFSGKHPLADLRDMESIFVAHLSGSLIRYAEGILSKVFAKDAAPLIKCLAVAPARRPSVDEISSFLKTTFDGAFGYLSCGSKLPDPVDETSRTAKSLWNIGQPKEAMTYLRRNLDMDPFQADSWFLLAEWSWEHQIQPIFSDKNSATGEVRKRLNTLLEDACIYGFRAMVLDSNYSDSNTKEGFLIGLVLPQTAYQFINGICDLGEDKLKNYRLGEDYKRWSHNLLQEQSDWLSKQERKITEIEGKSRCLCMRCGEVKMYMASRCPRCGFLPLEMEDLFLTYLTNKTLKYGVRHIDGKSEVPYWIRMQNFRQMGKEIEKNIALSKNDPGFTEGLEAFGRGDGAKLLDLVRHGPSAQEIKKVKEFVRHVVREQRKKSIVDKVKGFFGR